MLYRVLQSTDWSFLVGGEVIQVAIGFHDVQIHLFRDKTVTGPTISIGCDFEHRRAGVLLSGTEESRFRATTLVSLLGKAVKQVAADGEKSLTLVFDGGEAVTIITNDEPYECFTVTGRDGLIVV